MWGGGPEGERQGQEDAETAHHLQLTAVAATEPPLSANAIPGAARAGGTGGQFGPHTDTGKSQ